MSDRACYVALRAASFVLDQAGPAVEKAAEVEVEHAQRFRRLAQQGEGGELPGAPPSKPFARGEPDQLRRINQQKQESGRREASCRQGRRRHAKAPKERASGFRHPMPLGSAAVQRRAFGEGVARAAVKGRDMSRATTCAG